LDEHGICAHFAYVWVPCFSVALMLESDYLGPWANALVAL